jgi:hypothetical protein
MIRYLEERLINASAQEVYDAIIDFPVYVSWNPWIHFAKKNSDGTVTVKTRINGKEKVFKHKILAEDPAKQFHWCDLGWFTKLAFGQRVRTLEARDEGSCLYRCELRVEGIAEGLADKTHGTFMREGMEREADALKEYLESRQAC